MCNNRHKSLTVAILLFLISVEIEGYLDFTSKGKLLTLTFKKVHNYKNKYLYTNLVKFKLEHTHFEIILREYFMLHPHMHIYVNDIDLEYGSIEMPKYYYGEGTKTNQTSLVARLTNKYFNGTLYHERQVTFFNCRKLSPLFTNYVSLDENFFQFGCEIFHDAEVEKKVSELRQSRSQCGSQDETHIHKQSAATVYNQQYLHQKSESGRRQKRDTRSVTCVLHLVADHTFYENVGGSSIANTVGEMVSSVMEADVIFRGTDFDGNGAGDNIGFVVGNITIYTSSNDPSNRFASNNIGVYDFLDILTTYDFSSYCLGIGYTYRDFERGIVGLAWVASSSYYGAVGGICQNRITSGGQQLSYNTAMATYLNYDTFIPSQKSALTVTHELGHNFGSPHDHADDPQCSPDGIYGSYLMDPYANSGEKPNHRKFSQCSINSMYPVIVNKGNCFRRYLGPVCGNSVVEGNEECDCGTSGTCSYTDPCCTPSAPPSSSPDQGCTIRRSEGKQCSPITSPCCDYTCQIISRTSNRICRQLTECSLASYCSGDNSTCPAAGKLPDGRLCSGGNKVCINGVCSSSICQTHGLQECQCVSEEENMCKLCCKNPNITSCECLPASSFGIFNTNGDVLYQHQGQSCDSYRGFCDRRTCLSDDQQSIRTRMQQIFSNQNIQDIASWFKNHWYYVIISVVIVTLMAGVYNVTSIKIKNIDIDVEAMRYGRLMSMCRGADNQIQCFEETIEDMVDRFDSKILEIKTNRIFWSPLFAITRLKMLFPGADINVISHVVHSSLSEEFAVKMLLIRGYSMRKYCLKLKEKYHDDLLPDKTIVIK